MSLLLVIWCFSRLYSFSGISTLIGSLRIVGLTMTKKLASECEEPLQQSFLVRHCSSFVSRIPSPLHPRKRQKQNSQISDLLFLACLYSSSYPIRNLFSHDAPLFSGPDGDWQRPTHLLQKDVILSL